MTPPLNPHSTQPDRPQSNAEQQSDRYLDGAADAAFGRLPEFADDAYLAGYVTKLKELPQDQKGRIVHHSPARKFAFGFIDGIGDATNGESNDTF